ncbi:DsbA family protein [Patescibacteria group bacterium]|jgi:protein-disulfide isomerase|nr:DsbA family protein [Patescibacteria group bacterium]
MHIKTLVRRFTAATLLPVLLGLPMPSLAATPTPQQALTEALKSELTRSAGSLQMAGRVNVDYKPYKRGEPAGTGHVAFSMNARTLPTTDGAKPTLKNVQSEGRFAIESADLSGLPDSPEGFKLESPLSVQWKIVDGTFYVQLEKAPSSLVSMWQDLGMDLNQIIGRWVKFSADENELPDEVFAETAPADFIKLISSGDVARSLRMKNFFDRNPILQVTRVEKRFKNAAGEDIWRMRVRVNPAVVTFFYNEAYRDLPKSGTSRTEALKSLNASFAKIRLTLARTSMAANVNVAKKFIERFEVGGKYPETTKDCTYNFNLKRSVCTNTGTLTITVSAGASMSPNAGDPVTAPFMSITPEEAGNLLNPPQPEEPAPMGDLELDDDSTLTAPGVTVPAYDPATDHALGASTAKISMITYSDFQCPFCARFVQDAKQLLGIFPQDVRYVYRHFPLSSIHPEAQKAAEASECAAQLGGNDAFWRMHDKLFENQAIMNRDAYRSFAGQIGLDIGTFTTCLDSGSMAARVKRDADMAQALGIQGTPTSFIGNTRLEGALPVTILQDEAEMAGATQ